MGAASKTLAIAGLLGMLHWLFGNLYETIVIAPNWVVDSTAQLDRLHGFFTRTTPTAYFVPISLLAPMLIWAAHALNRVPAATPAFRRASAFALLAAAHNAFIVITIVTVRFGDDYRARSDAELHALCVRWNVLNSVRMALTAATVLWIFAAFRTLDRGPRVVPMNQVKHDPSA
jgi:hypothetical protein